MREMGSRSRNRENGDFKGTEKAGQERKTHREITDRLTSGSRCVKRKQRELLHLTH